MYALAAVDPSRRLERAVAISGKSKRQLVDEAVRDHFTDEGLVLGHVALREEVPEVMTLDEAAALLRLEPSALEQAARDDQVPARRVAGRGRFAKAALIAWLDHVENAHDDSP